MRASSWASSARTGAGKTTVFNLLTGVYVPTEGAFYLCGQKLNGKQTYQVVEAGIARTFQNIRLFKAMTVLDNVKIAFTKDIHYNLADSLLRTKKYWNTEQELTEKAMEYLRIVHLDDKAGQLASSPAIRPAAQARDRPRAGNEHEAAAARRAGSRHEPDRDGRAALVHQYHPRYVPCGHPAH